MPVYNQVTPENEGLPIPSLLEIKCPFVCRDKSIEEAVATTKDFYLGYD
jgi:hypothetical protein